jgi:hypothetical protein
MAATPTTAPMAIPAIAPFDSSSLVVAGTEVEEDEVDVVAGAVLDVGVEVDAVSDVVGVVV